MEVFYVKKILPFRLIKPTSARCPIPGFEQLINHWDSTIESHAFPPSFLKENYLVFKFVGILVFFLVEINEVMSDAILGFRIHIPRNLEGITRDVTYFDIVWDRKFLHLCNPTVLWFIPCIKKKKEAWSVKVLLDSVSCGLIWWHLWTAFNKIS